MNPSDIESNGTTVIDNLVCLVIDKVMETTDLDNMEDSAERADLYRQVGEELLDLAMRMDAEREYEERFGGG